LRLLIDFEMGDVLTPAQRSKCMAAIRGTNTSPEIAVRRIAHQMSFRFRLHAKELPGKPDLVFPRLRSVIFVHGCFWHQHTCNDGHMPKTRLDYWKPKLKLNQDRDRRRRSQLRKLGWRVLVIWECQTKDSERLRGRLKSFLKSAPN
jgi:DNA mismatch endonuclease (patch repair protein)